MARVVLQRVRRASVSVGDECLGEIERGLCVLIGIREGDAEADVDKLAAKVASLRIFEDSGGKMNLSTSEVGGDMLVVSQFTLFADASKGRRPSFIHAARPEDGERLYQRFAGALEGFGYRVERGRFGAHMLVAIENDGPVTIILDSEQL
jgi:D-aminoacyl-tRNA deacylase